MEDKDQNIVSTGRVDRLPLVFMNYVILSFLTAFTGYGLEAILFSAFNFLNLCVKLTIIITNCEERKFKCFHTLKLDNMFILS